MDFGLSVREGLFDDVGDLRDLIDAHEGVHFRHEFWQFIAKPLRKAARNNNRLAAIFRLPKLNGFKNRVHAFFLGRIDEGTGVDDDGIGLSGVVGDFNAGFKQGTEHDFGIHQIFGAAQRNQPDAQRSIATRLGSRRRVYTGFSFRHGTERIADIRRVAMLRNVEGAPAWRYLFAGRIG